METKRALGDAKNWRANNREDLELSLRKKGPGARQARSGRADGGIPPKCVEGK